MNVFLKLLRNIGKGTGHFFKNLFKQKGLKRYTLLLFLSTLIFIIVLFPYNKIVYSFINNAQLPGIRTLDITGLDIQIAGNASATTVNIIDMGNRKYHLTEADIKIKPIDFLLRNRLNAEFQSESIHYEDPVRKINGKIEIKANMLLDRQTRIPKSGNINLNAKQLTIGGLKIQGFTIPDVLFSSVQAEINYQENNIQIERFQFGGTQLRGSISGGITTPENSRMNLNLTIQINSESQILEDYGMFINQLKNPSTGGLVIKVTGTPGKPDINFEK
jgi:hypothetical protein